AVPKLAVLLKDKNVTLRLSAVNGLGRIGPRATLPLVEALKDADADVRHLAIGSLGSPAAEEMNEAEVKVAIPALIQALADPRLRASAAEGLGFLGPAAARAVPALAELVKDGDSAAEFALMKIDPEALKKARKKDPENR